ncbi:HNH endonuclease [Collinsella aerofaciens]|uniref:HNH endonuclease n=1 Tax=Collinsella aerofaciens TaxID=74426 RepID=UPI001896A568|nr:HNH endonuclease [Collinsella aerofaciens]
MAERRKNWSREETLAALFLYLALPARLIDDKGGDVQTLARAIGRTPAAVSLKIWNLASFDERRRARGKVGMVNASKMDKLVWAEYSSSGDALVEEAAEAFFGQLDSDNSMSSELKEAIGIDLPEGRERETIISTRVNQQFFRNTLLANYNSHCCLTGLSNPKLLVASHIKPWSVSDPRTERLAPDNGLLLNALHDKAFDQGLITITKDLKIVISSVVGHGTPEDEFLWRYNGERIALPKQSSPRPEFIEYHNDMVFKG